MQIDRSLVGKSVQVPGRPEWGVGRVLRVEPHNGSAPAARVTIQFPHGTRVMLVPPAVLAEPQQETAEARAPTGWLDSLAGKAPDDRLTKVPESILQVLGDPAARFAAVLPLFAYSAQPDSLLRWARSQARVADPLSHWSRDELTVAFGKFVLERDALLREIAARIRMSDGAAALSKLVKQLEEPVKTCVVEALRRIL